MCPGTLSFVHHTTQRRSRQPPSRGSIRFIQQFCLQCFMRQITYVPCGMHFFVQALRTIRDFVRDRTLQSQDQVALRQLCMQYWNLPIGAPRVALPAPVPQAVLANLQRFLVQKERSLFSATTAGDKARSSALPAHKLPKLLESTSEIGALRRVPTFNLSDAAFVGRVLRSVRVLAAPRRPYAAQYSLCRAAKTPNNSGHQPQWSALCIHHQSHGLLVGRGQLNVLTDRSRFRKNSRCVRRNSLTSARVEHIYYVTCVRSWASFSPPSV